MMMWLLFKERQIVNVVMRKAVANIKILLTFVLVSAYYALTALTKCAKI